MIQRIQTLFLFLAACIAVAMIFIPVGTIVDSATMMTMYEYDALSLKPMVNDTLGSGIYSTAYIAILWAVSAILSVITIFMYKKRPRQISLNSINMLVILAAMGMMLYIYPNVIFERNQFVTDRAIVNFNKLILLSVIPAIALVAANWAIKRDERLVRAADRLR